jgi:hypothetical protein
VKLRVRWPAAAAAAMTAVLGLTIAGVGLTAAVLGLTVAGGPAAGAAGLGGAGATARAAAGAAPPAAGSSHLTRQDVGGSELASPGVAVHYPAAGAVPLPQVPASAYVVADADTGQVLAGSGAPRRVPRRMRYDSALTARFPVTPHTVVPLVNQNRLLTQYPGGIGGKIGWTEAAEATYIGMARRHGVTLIVTVLHCTSLQEITAGEKLLDWGFAMDGRVRPVGELVRPLPALTASHRKPGRPAPRGAAASPVALPAVPLAAGAGVIIIVVLSAGWLGRRRRFADPGRRHADAERPLAFSGCLPRHWGLLAARS